jgi:rfaE bifunctional protein nucleotidyltransferase chain/domain
VIGDALLDRDVEGTVARTCPDQPDAPVLDRGRAISRPGGAALAATLAAGEGREVTMITALGRDGAGEELAWLLGRQRVEVVDLGLDGPTPEKVRLRAQGRTLARIDRGEAGARVGPLTAAARAAIGWADAILVSDYGRGLAAHPAVRELLGKVSAGRPVVWDPHPRGPAPIEDVALATPNRGEAEILVAAGGESAACGESAGGGLSLAFAHTRQRAQACGMQLAARWRARHVCVTCSAEGAVLCTSSGARHVPAPAVACVDACGAGDRFAVAAAGGLGDGATALHAVRSAVRSASAFVAAGGAGAIGMQAGDGGLGAAVGMRWSPTEASGWSGGLAESASPMEERLDALALAREVRGRGGRVVATGGCFDLLHAGHIATLQAARRLGDCLIVCLNSDASVARLKGPTRPLVGEGDRAQVLRALACVDAVMVFAEDTPERALARLRPDVWAKGGDYEASELPERALVESWGGRVATLPYLDGHSTSGLLQEVAYRGAG